MSTSRTRAICPSTFFFVHTSPVHFFFSCMFISIYAIPKCHKLISWNCLHITGRFYSSTASRRRQRLPQLKSGHNLTSRGELLTKTIQRQLKQKEDVNNNNYNNVNSGSTSGEIEVASIGDPGMTLGMPVSKVFRGMIVPEKPIPPGPDGTFSFHSMRKQKKRFLN